MNTLELSYEVGSAEALEKFAILTPQQRAQVAARLQGNPKAHAALQRAQDALGSGMNAAAGHAPIPGTPAPVAAGVQRLPRADNVQKLRQLRALSDAAQPTTPYKPVPSY